MFGRLAKEIGFLWRDDMPNLHWRLIFMTPRGPFVSKVAQTKASKWESFLSSGHNTPSRGKQRAIYEVKGLPWQGSEVPTDQGRRACRLAWLHYAGLGPPGSFKLPTSAERCICLRRQ